MGDFGAKASQTIPQLAVVDLETTGIFPARHERVIEIAIVHVSNEGNVTQEYSTLINPRRDVGPVSIHGITAGDVADAPCFDEIAGDISRNLNGRVVAGHNIRFDMDFLGAEFRRLGHEPTIAPTICTMRLSRQIGSLSSLRLSDCCSTFGIRLEDAHTALGDARATARLVLRCLSEADRMGMSPAGEMLSEGPVKEAWPLLPGNGRVHPRHRALEARREPSYLAKLGSRLSSGNLARNDSALEYLALLERVLEDRQVTAEEAELLVETATRWDISTEQVEVIHRDFMAALAVAALEDGVVTEAELRDLSEVARLFGFDTSYVPRLLETAHSGSSRSNSTSDLAASNPLVGKSVCFTGELQSRWKGGPLTRDLAEQFAAKAGLLVVKTVTKKLDILVVADPSTQSGKANKARTYGTRIMAEAVFWRSLGVRVE